MQQNIANKLYRIRTGAILVTALALLWGTWKGGLLEAPRVQITKSGITYEVARDTQYIDTGFDGVLDSVIVHAKRDRTVYTQKNDPNFGQKQKEFFGVKKKYFWGIMEKNNAKGAGITYVHEDTMLVDYYSTGKPEIKYIADKESKVTREDSSLVKRIKNTAIQGSGKVGLFIKNN